MVARVVVTFIALVCACDRDGEPRVSPDEGSMRGGERVRIDGSDFVGHGPATVHLGDEAAKAVVVESPWLVTFTTPAAETAGAVGLRILFADGTAFELDDAFFYVDPGEGNIVAGDE
jgi:hypothetical protein